MTSPEGDWGLELPEDAVERLLAYERLLGGRGVALGVVARSDLPRLRTRHLVDSLRAVRAIRADDRSGVDLGSGGGLPGIPVAIACPGLMVTLVERRRIRAAFLESVVEELHLANVGVVFGSVESLPSGADVCFARAFADARGSWEAAGRVLAASGRLIYFAGAGVDPSSLPEDAHVEILGLPPFASGGPLVIMSRQ